MSAVGPKADVGLCAAHVRFRGDCVAKVFAALRERNNRIRLNASLNQYCVSAFVLESMLLDLVVKIVLQHYRPKADILKICQSRLAISAWIRNSSGIVPGSRQPKPHSVAMEKFETNFRAVNRRFLLP